MRNATLHDVAEAAGLSYATVDRVINRRGNVAEKSVRKVQDAMQSLGYVRNIAAANLSRGRVYRFAFVVPGGNNAFFLRLRTALGRLAAHLTHDNVETQVLEVAAFSRKALQRTLEEAASRDLDGLAVVGLSGPTLEAPLQAIRDRGVKVVSLVSDLPDGQRDAYVGVDNLAAGRTAARLLGLSHGNRRGRVLTLAGSLNAADHARRLDGFKEVMTADYPHIAIMPPRLTRDAPRRVEAAVAEAFETAPCPSVIYNAGAGNSGLVKALAGIAPRAKPLCLVHELVSHSRAALDSGLIDYVIDQRPEIEVSRAVTLLRALVDAREPPPMPALVPTIYVRDNLPDPSDDRLEERPQP